MRFRLFRDQQSPKYQTTLLTYRTFNNPSLLANGTQTTSNKFTDDSSCRSYRVGPKFRETSVNDGRRCSPTTLRSPASIRPALKPHHRDYQRDSRFVLRHYRRDKSIGLKARFRATAAGQPGISLLFRLHEYQ